MTVQPHSAAPLDVGVLLPPVGPAFARPATDMADAARHAEDLGLDSIWAGDHLATGTPSLDCVALLAAAATATERIRVGTAVYVPALRPLAWAAKQIATLQYLSAGRLLLGVGTGGPWPDQWDAAGVPFSQRGRRTDALLERLSDLLAGTSTALDDTSDAPVVELTPSVPRPPVWVGNASEAAMRRAARLGDGWFPSLVTPDTVATGRAALDELSACLDRPAPTIAVGAIAALGERTGAATRDQMAQALIAGYGMDAGTATEIPLTGTPEDVATRLLAYRDAGAHHVVIGIFGDDWRRQCEHLAEARLSIR